MNLLSATGVSHDYPHHGRVLHAIHLAIAPGETVAPARTQRLWEKHPGADAGGSGNAAAR